MPYAQYNCILQECSSSLVAAQEKSAVSYSVILHHTLNATMSIPLTLHNTEATWAVSQLIACSQQQIGTADNEAHSAFV